MLAVAVARLLLLTCALSCLQAYLWDIHSMTFFRITMVSTARLCCCQQSDLLLFALGHAAAR